MRKLLLALLALVLAAGLAGCGGSDGGDGADGGDEPEAAEATSSTTSSTALAGDDIDAEASPYCAAWKDIRTAEPPEITTSGDAPEDDEARKEFYARILPSVRQLVEHADEQIAASAQVALDITTEAAETGKFEVFETEESRAAQAELTAYAQEHCQKG